MEALLVIIMVWPGMGPAAQVNVVNVPTLEVCERIISDLQSVGGLRFGKCYVIKSK